jgi:hypothetical protein
MVRISPYTSIAQRDVLFHIVPKRVTLLVEGRNAWHSTWIREYQDNAVMFTNQSSARLAAEYRRKQGSVFYVFDAPALLLLSVHTNCIVTDFHTENPFGGFVGFRQPPEVQRRIGNRVYTLIRPGIVPGVSMSTAMSSIGAHESMWEKRNPSQHSFVRGSVGDGRDLADLDGELQSVCSFPQGAGYRLGWREGQQRYSTAGTQKVADAWSEQLDAIPEVARLFRDLGEELDQGVRRPGKRTAEKYRKLLATALSNHAVSTFGEVARWW